jgi:hypothetical protein
MARVDLSAIMGPEAQERLASIGGALGLSANRVVSRDCIGGFHGKCDGHAQAARQHPEAERQLQGKPGGYDQRLPCFCGCHEGFKPR